MPHAGLRWAAVASMEPALLLEQARPTRAFQRMVLRLEDDALRLHDETGALLAEGSDLPALLDAVNGGVGEPAGQAHPPAPATVSAGVAITSSYELTPAACPRARPDCIDRAR